MENLFTTKLYFTNYRLRSRDLIMNNLIVANSSVILCKRVTQRMDLFGLKDILKDC
jgi:hypothetical protein